MNEFSLRWKMKSPGSADFTLCFPEETVAIHTTYLGDGLGSVVRSAVDLRLGSSSTFAFLPAESGGSCMFFGGAGEEVYLQIVDFVDMQSESRRWSGGSLRWHGRVGVKEFIRGVVLMADDLLVQCGGNDAYLKAWGGIAFPGRELETLRSGL